MNVEVQMRDVAVAKGNDNLVAQGVGSCVLIAIHDRRHRIGGMAHAVLAGIPSRGSPLSHGKYVDEAIDELLQQMARMGADRRELQAKLVGGANMFAAFESNLGAENVAGARAKLKREDIPVVGECVGGSQGRSVEFSVATGIVTVKTKF